MSTISGSGNKMPHLMVSAAALRIVAATFSLLALSGVATRHANAAPMTNQEVFATPEQGAEALLAAWRSGGKAALLEIFGHDSQKLVSSGDPVADSDARARLVAAYQDQHRIEAQGDDKAVLVIGKDEFPFPIPLVKQGASWHFDAAAGAEEILNRQIGSNELSVIAVSRAYVEAQRDYAALNPLHEYAMKVASSPGKHDGLYWPVRSGEEESPLGPLVASAEAEGYAAPNPLRHPPYHGYYYRILTGQGANAPGGAKEYVVHGRMTRGFAMVAFPAEYGVSGVMTFIVNETGIVFEKNLGPDTERIARQMRAYDPDMTWAAH
jgi:hypothetical protein